MLKNLKYILLIGIAYTVFFGISFLLSYLLNVPFTTGGFYLFVVVVIISILIKNKFLSKK
jgi:hypothetical protein